MLTDAQRAARNRQIVEMRRAGSSYREIAERFHLTVSGAQRVVERCERRERAKGQFA